MKNVAIFFLERNPKETTRKMPLRTISFMMLKWHHLDSNSGIHKGFKNDLKQCVDDILRFYQILVDYKQKFDTVHVFGKFTRFSKVIIKMRDEIHFC